MKLLVANASFERDTSSAIECKVLLAALRALHPARLDLAALDTHPTAVPGELRPLVDNVIVDHPPRGLGLGWLGSLFGARFRAQRAGLFRGYDAVLCAPGSLSPDRAAALLTLADLDAARKVGVPFILSGHSIGPLDDLTVERVRLATLCVSREDATHAYLTDRGIPCVRGASLAFLYQRAASERRRNATESYRALFIGAPGAETGRVERHDRRLQIGPWAVELDPKERLLLATTNGGGRRVQDLSRRLRAPAVACRTPQETFGLIADSSGVVSDSFTPAACAVALARPLVLVSTSRSHEMLGAESMSRLPDLPSCRARAEAALDAVREALRAPLRQT